MLYFIPRALLKILFTIACKVTTRWEIYGLENLPKQGPYIIAINHLHYFDPPIVYASMPWRMIFKVRAFAAEKYRHTLIGLPVHLTHGIFVKRGELDRDALREALGHLKEGNMLAIAPEGTRSKTGGLQEGKPGIIYLAQRTNAPIIPLAIYGQERVWQELKRGRRQRVVERIGEPFVLPPLDRKRKNEQMDELTTELMCKIAALLPEEYRGVYAQDVCQRFETARG